MSGTFAYIGAIVEKSLNSFVSGTSAALAAGITPLVATGVAIWVTLYGYAVMTNEVNEPINVFVKKATRIAIVLAFALGTGLYQSEIVAGVADLQNGLVNIMNRNGNQGTVYTLLDNFDAKGAEYAIIIIGYGVNQLPLGGYLDILAGALVFAANAIILMFAAGFILTTKVATAFVLGLGPLFIAALAFPATNKFFDAWLSKVINYGLLIGMLAFAITLSIGLSEDYLTQAMAVATTDATNRIADAFGLVAVYGALLVVIWQSPSIAAGLAGGSSLSGGGIGGLVQSYVVGRLARGGRPKDSGGDLGGGSITESGSGGRAGPNGGGSGSSGSLSSSRVPEYQRARQNRPPSRK